MSVVSAWPSLASLESHMVSNRILEVHVFTGITPNRIYVNIGLMKTEEEVKGQSFKGYGSRFSLSLCKLHYVQYCSLFNALREHGDQFKSALIYNLPPSSCYQLIIVLTANLRRKGQKYSRPLNCKCVPHWYQQLKSWETYPLRSLPDFSFYSKVIMNVWN